MLRHWLLCKDSFTASAADLKERFLLSGVVYLILLPAIFQRLPGAGSLTLILAELHVDIFET